VRGPHSVKRASLLRRNVLEGLRWLHLKFLGSPGPASSRRGGLCLNRPALVRGHLASPRGEGRDVSDPLRAGEELRPAEVPEPALRVQVYYQERSSLLR